MLSALEPTTLPLPASHIEDLRLASSHLSGAERRAFQAAMALKYGGGDARGAERVFGWGRETVQLGLHEQRTGLICVGAQAARGGHRLWEEQHPEVAQALWGLAEAPSQQDPTFRAVLAYTRLTAAEALAQLRAQGFPEECLPSPSTMAAVLNRNGYRLRKAIEAKPQKNSRKPMPSSPTSPNGMASPSRRRMLTEADRSSARASIAKPR
jgi:hypothetical protein